MRWTRWRVVGVVFLGAVALGIATAWWFAPLKVDPPFDVDAFLADELFGEDRAPAAYREIIPLVDAFNEKYPGAWDPPTQGNFDADDLLRDSDEIAARLIEAGRRPPGAFIHPRHFLVGDYLTVSQSMRSAGRLLTGRARLLLDDGRTDEALPLILEAIRLGRHLAFRGPLVSGISGIATESDGTTAFGEWAAHESVTPDSILDALESWRSIEPAPPWASDLLKGEYVYNVRGFDDPRSLYPGGSPPSGLGQRIRRSAERFLLGMAGVSGNQVVSAFNALLWDRLAWCDRPAWERREWTTTFTGPEHLSPAVPGVHLTRAELDEIVKEAVLVRLLVPALDQAAKAVDGAALGRAVMETKAALLAYRKRTGRYPERLDELVPGLLPELPVDPYSGEPLGWSVSDQDVFEAQEEDKTSDDESAPALVLKAGVRVLYSVGPKGIRKGDADWLTSDRIDREVCPLP